MLKVLMLTRANYRELPGGDTIQLLKTKKYLEHNGIKVDVATGVNFNPKDYNLVHLFNLTEEDQTLEQLLIAKEAKKPVALSTIYWDQSEYFLMGQTAHCSFGRKIKVKIINSVKLNLGKKNMSKRLIKQQQILNISDHLLPNAHAEMSLLEKNFGIRKNYTVVPNAVDLKFSDADPEWFITRYGLKDFILCVGRIEIRKNQLALIKALRDTEIPLLLIGTPTGKGYYGECKRAADANVHFIPHLEQKYLKSAYAAAKVHVLPSWYETPGLASLEAALVGCNIVSTNRGTAREYFKDLVFYCDPQSIKSIKNSCLEAYYNTPKPELKDYIRTNYNWQKTAEKTMDAYHRILGQ